MRILHLDENHPLLKRRLDELGFQNDEDYQSSKVDIEAKISAYQGLVIRSRFPIDKAFLQKAKALRFIARLGAGMENIDVTYAAQCDIKLFNAAEGNRNAVGEHALTLLLALLNKIVPANEEVRRGLWRREAQRGEELDGKTVGIIGYGHTGKAFAKKLRGFEVRVLAHDILEDVGDAQATQVPLEQLWEEADVLSLHIPQTPLTIGMVNDAFIRRFKKPFYLINTARGSALKTSDLVEHLKTAKVKGAGLDVLEYEGTNFQTRFQQGDMPAAFRYLTRANNVILSPHVAGWTVESKRKLAETIVEKIGAAFGSRPN